MRILYVGNWKQSSGWSDAALGLIQALDSVGLDVVPRAINMGGPNRQVPQRVLDLEKKSQAGCDIVIQHVLPHMFEYDGRYQKNIIYFAAETNKINRVWVQHLNLADEVWVINAQMERAALDSGVKKPIFVVPHAFDMVKYAQSYPVLPELESVLNKGDFVFLQLSEFVRRKGFVHLLKAFFAEFKPWEPVQLVIKTNKAGVSVDELNEHVGQFIEEIKKGLKLGPSNSYKKPILITGQMSESQVMSLHKSCHCFVSPSHGEAWSIPTFSSLAMGKPPIVTDCTGFKEYVTEETGWLVKCRLEDCFGAVDSLPDLYRSDEQWWTVDVMDLRRCMREAYENRDLLKQKGLAGINKSYDFSYQKVGNLMKGILDGS